MMSKKLGLLLGALQLVAADTTTASATETYGYIPPSATQGVSTPPTALNASAPNAQDLCPGYTANNVTTTNNTVTATLTLAGDACNVYGNDVQSLDLTVTYQTAERLSVNIVPTDKNNSMNFILPDAYVLQPKAEDFDGAPLLNFSYTNNGSFQFWITRVEDGAVTWDSRGTKLVYEDQFIEFITSTPEDPNLYGLGEAMMDYKLLNGSIHTFWAADIGDPIDTNLYGSHPVLLEVRYDTVDNATTGTGHATYLRNSNAQEVLLQDQQVVWRTIGGVLDLYFFAGSTPIEAQQQYVQAIGLPAMHQYWTFGFHQCRWGYLNISMTKDVVENYRNANIPLETQWNDIDYMSFWRDFTTDATRFGANDFREFIAWLQSNNQHYIPIVDAGVYRPNPQNESDWYNASYARGTEMNAFHLNPDGSEYVGEVWPGYAVWPDFFTDNGTQFWAEAFMNFSQIVNMSGVWLDMNEASSFVIGSAASGLFGIPALQPVNDTFPAGYDINFPKYAINNDKTPGQLSMNTMAVNVTSHDGSRQYDIHNLFGYSETRATYEAMTQVHPGVRPFIIARSTFAGSGRYGGHWGGDNSATFQYLALAIPQALSFQLFGIPMFGVDTCGFNGNTTEELCARWMAMDAFLPFYRNHNTEGALSQEAYQWASVAEASRLAMNIRYSLLPYFYTLLYASHTTGTPILYSLMLAFPNDPTLAGADRQFLVGQGLLVTPVLTENATTVDGVFPGAGADEAWYDWYTQQAINVSQVGENKTLDAPLTHINVAVRGGYILPIQEPAYTTAESRLNPWALLVPLSLNGTASGNLYSDDGESIDVGDNYATFDFTATNGTLSVSKTAGNYTIAQPLANITVLGVATEPTNVTFNGAAVTSSWNASVLSVTGLANATADGAFSDSWTLTWA